jgi:hypothetical protein
MGKQMTYLGQTELNNIRTRDAESGETWFTGPASFTAQAARDRRALLGEVDRLILLVRQKAGEAILAAQADEHRVVELREAATYARKVLSDWIQGVDPAGPQVSKAWHMLNTVLKSDSASNGLMQDQDSRKGPFDSGSLAEGLVATGAGSTPGLVSGETNGTAGTAVKASAESGAGAPTTVLPAYTREFESGVRAAIEAAGRILEPTVKVADDAPVKHIPASGLDDERRWQAMANLMCEAEKFYLQHGGKGEWDALMDETNRILDLDDATLIDNLSERRPTDNAPKMEHPTREEAIEALRAITRLVPALAHLRNAQAIARDVLGNAPKEHRP